MSKILILTLLLINFVKLILCKGLLLGHWYTSDELIKAQN